MWIKLIGFLASGLSARLIPQSEESKHVAFVREKVEKNDSRFELHEVTTPDGYILQVFHLFSDNPNEAIEPVLMWHGLFQDAGAWIFNAKNPGVKPPALEAVDNSLDIWLGNSRGTLYSSKHMHLDKDDVEHRNKFWDFSWSDIGQHDLPTVINYVNEYT